MFQKLVSILVLLSAHAAVAANVEWTKLHKLTGVTVPPSIRNPGTCLSPAQCSAVTQRNVDPFRCEDWSDCCVRPKTSKCGSGSTCYAKCKPGCFPSTGKSLSKASLFYRKYSCAYNTQRKLKWSCSDSWRCVPGCRAYKGTCPAGTTYTPNAKCGTGPGLRPCNADSCCSGKPPVTGTCSTFACNGNGFPTPEVDTIKCTAVGSPTVTGVPVCSTELCCNGPGFCDDTNILCQDPVSQFSLVPQTRACGGESKPCNVEHCCLGITTSTTCLEYALEIVGWSCPEVNGLATVLNVFKPCGPDTNSICGTGACCYYPPSLTSECGCQPTNSLCLTGECAEGSKTCNYIPANCNDNNQCTVDSCNAATGCTYTNITCDDNDPCTFDECDPLVGCFHSPNFNAPGCAKPPVCTPTVCNDKNACTLDTCSIVNGALSCAHTPTRCQNDKDKCQIGTCNPKIGCVYTPLVCQDSNKCTNDFCEPKLGKCRHLSVDIPPPADKCLHGFCTPDGGVGYANVTCTSTDQCVIASCDSSVGCVYTQKKCASGCSCISGLCVCKSPTPGAGCRSAKDCVGNAPDPCTVAKCVQNTCEYSPRVCPAAPDFCTVVSCENDCVPVPRQCTDNSLCSTDSCDPSVGCVFSEISCDNPKNKCNEYSCNPLTGCTSKPVVCPDSGNPCAPNVCYAEKGCVPTQTCTTDDPCKIAICDATTKYQCQIVDKCDDGIACTADSCNAGVCTFTDTCTPTAPCVAASCNATSQVCQCDPVPCQNCVSDACTERTCNTTTGVCTAKAIQCPQVNCKITQGSLAAGGCTTVGDVVCPSVDACNTGVCNPADGACGIATKNCDDGNPCTYDSCNPNDGVCKHTPKTCTPPFQCFDAKCDGKGGCVSQANNTKCDDDDFCTIDTCVGGEGNKVTGCLHTPTPITQLPCTCPNGKQPTGCFNKRCICPTCAKQVDLTFVIDASGSIGNTNFNGVRAFAQNIAAAFTNDPRFGGNLFSQTVRTIKELNSCPNVGSSQNELQCFKNAIRTANYPAQNTNTVAGLQNAIDIFRKAGNRPNVQDVTLLFTDGVPNFGEWTKTGDCLPSVEEVAQTRAKAAELKRTSKVITLGVHVPTNLACCPRTNNRRPYTCTKETPQAILQSLATSPDYYVALDNFNRLQEVVDLIVSLLCN